jgi:hypothetical protein
MNESIGLAFLSAAFSALALCSALRSTLAKRRTEQRLRRVLNHFAAELSA